MPALQVNDDNESEAGTEAHAVKVQPLPSLRNDNESRHCCKRVASGIADLNLSTTSQAFREAIKR